MTLPLYFYYSLLFILTFTVLYSFSYILLFFTVSVKRHMNGLYSIHKLISIS